MAGRTLASALFATLLVAGPLRGQAPTVEVDPTLPFATRRVIDTAIDAEGASVWTGDTVVLAGAIHAGSVVQVGGTLILEGRVTGDLTAIDAEVYVRPGARVDGDLTVLGGALSGSSMATFGGRSTWLRDEPVDAVEVAPGAWRIDRLERDLGFPFEAKGVGGITVDMYDGVDGLSFGLLGGLKKLPGQPRTELTFGPVFRSARSDVGWRVAGLREIPSAGDIVLGGSTYRVTTSPERWHRGNRGNSLASFVFADDDRTYYERTGGEVYLEKSFLLPLAFRVHGRIDDMKSLESLMPFAVLGDDEDWRENPPIDEGQGRVVGATLTVDRRDVPGMTTRGFWAEGRIDHWGLGGDFDFDWAQAEARTWLPLPVGSRSFLSVRVMGGGRLRTAEGDTLSPQFWYRLGGGSTIPGYDALQPSLTGDRMAFATGTVHLGIPAGGPTLKRYFERIYLVGVASVGDAWFEGEERTWQAGFGGGIAGAGSSSYAGVFAAYGVEEEQWQVYARLTPWF